MRLFFRLYSYTHCVVATLHPKQCKKHIYKSCLSRKTFLPSYADVANCAAVTALQDSGGAVLYSIHDRHFGITDEYFMA